MTHTHRLQALPAWLAAAVLATAATASHAKPEPRVVQGTVTHVSDGDSLWVTPPGAKPIEVRLRDVDAPESCQPYGAEARAALAELALNKAVTLQISARDSYGRSIAAVMIEEVNVSRYLVENGHAWSTRSRWDQGPLVKQEKVARALARGLHAAPGALQPKDFRLRHGRCEVPAADTARR